MIAALAFDLDNTLYDHAQFVRGAHADVAAVAAEAAGLDPERFLARIHGDWRRLTSRANTIFADALRDFGAFSPELEARLVAAYRAHQPRLEPFPGVAAALERARAAGLRLGLLTDGQVAVQNRKIEALGLVGRFDALVVTGELGPGFAKPHPAGFELLARRLGTFPACMVYIGDNPLVDFAPARRLGMRTLRVRTAEYLRETAGTEWIDHSFDDPCQAVAWALDNRQGIPSP
ncbi:MAG: HAD family hydrolase [Lentisphaeria bacterium]|jgi:putative hydrolase of the HAD superfamily|nr:HAD family hydrolase [Lentisphaeria bacterium]